MASRSDWFLGLALAGTIVVWGSAFTAIKILVSHLDPIDAAVLRMAFAALPFLALWWAKRASWRRRPPMDAAGARRVFVLGALGVPVYHLALNAGEARIAATQSADVTAGLSALLVSTTPIFTFLVSVAILHERVTLRKVVGLVTALAGVALLVVWGRGVRMEWAAVEGTLLVLVAPVSWGFYSVWMKRELRTTKALPLTTYTMLAGMMLLVPLTTPQWAASMATLPPAAWFWAAWLGLAATFAGYVVWNLALDRWDPTSVSTAVYFTPLVAIAWAVVLTGERVTLQLATGGALILAGVWLASSRRRATPTPRVPA